MSVDARDALPPNPEIPIPKALLPMKLRDLFGVTTSAANQGSRDLIALYGPRDQTGPEIAVRDAYLLTASHTEQISDVQARAIKKGASLSPDLALIGFSGADIDRQMMEDLSKGGLIIGISGNPSVPFGHSVKEHELDVYSLRGGKPTKIDYVYLSDTQLIDIPAARRPEGIVEILPDSENGYVSQSLVVPGDNARVTNIRGTRQQYYHRNGR